GCVCEWRRTVIARHDESPEQRLLHAGLIVDLTHNLFLIVVGSEAVSNLSARIIRLRKAAGDFQCYGMEQRRVDAVVYKRSFQRDLPARVANGRGEGRKIARKHCC